MINKKKIIIIEDQPLLNNLMQKILSNDYDIVATSTTAKDMLDLAKEYQPDLILTDVITKYSANGISYGKKVKDLYGKKIKVLAITGMPDITFLNEAKESNLDGLIYKDIDTNSLLLSISQILNGYTLFPDNYSYNEDNEKLKTLTEKELHILKLLCNGFEREYIAKKLNVTQGTLKNYISNILNKMGFDNISKLTMFCVSNGYIVPNLEK